MKSLLERKEIWQGEESGTGDLCFSHWASLPSLSGAERERRRKSFCTVLYSANCCRVGSPHDVTQLAEGCRAA